MLKTNASKQACMRAYISNALKGCALLHGFMHASVHAWHNSNAYNDSKHLLT